MTDAAFCNRKISGSDFTWQELSDAFDTVKDAEHWKNPIDAHAPKDRQDILYHAIVYFTGSIPDFLPCPDGQVRVMAAGYFLAIGA